MGRIFVLETRLEVADGRIPAHAGDADPVVGVGGGYTGGVGAMLDDILEGVAIGSKRNSPARRTCRHVRAAAVDAGVEDGDLHGGVAGRDVPALRRIDIRIGCPVDGSIS